MFHLDSCRYELFVAEIQMKSKSLLAEMDGSDHENTNLARYSKTTSFLFNGGKKLHK